MRIMILVVSAIAFVLVITASAPVDQRLVLKVRYDNDSYNIYVIPYD